MKKILMICAAAIAVLTGCKDSSYKLRGSLGQEYGSKTVVLANYDDSVAIDSVRMEAGRFSFQGKADTVAMSMLMVDGRTRAYIVLEPGKITLAEKEHFATGTTGNDNLSRIVSLMDSVEQLDNMQEYTAFVQKLYEQNRTTPLALYLGVELSRYLELPQIDKMLTDAMPAVKASHRIAGYRRAAGLRKTTMPGMKFTDFEAVQPGGKTVKLSDYIGNGKYLLVDFWASWCPYCIKELPELQEIYKQYGDDGPLQILGVAVRDEASDTEEAVRKHGITWPVMYNAKRIPYDIYGFTGIPHMMLISPDGAIIARGETARQTAVRLRQLIKQE